MIQRALFRFRAAAVRRWFRANDDANAYEVDAYIRVRWPQLTENERRSLIQAVATAD